MKKLILFFLLLTITIYPYKLVTTLMTINNNLLVDIIEIKNKKGFVITNKVTQIFLITDKNNFYKTFINKNYDWEVLVDCYNGETLGIAEYTNVILTDDSKMIANSRKINIPVKTIYYNETKIINFIFSLPIGDLKCLRLSFFREDLL